jgi:DNA-binding GntR family transcriptional regulator
MSEVDSCYTANQAFQRIEDAYTRRHNRDFVEALYRYHIELNRLSGNQYLEFFYRRPYIRFYTILLADLTPGEHWEQYILNYRMIHDMILSGDAHSSVTSFVGHIRWVLRNMRNDDSA